MYEPFSAISTGGVYHPQEVQEVQTMLRQWQEKLPSGVRFLYGGSINGDNVKDYASLAEVSGFVVGHASLDPQDFFSIIDKCLTPTTSLS